MTSTDDGQTFSSSGCKNYVPESESNIKEFFSKIKDHEIVLTNDRVIWDNLLTELSSLVELDNNWIEKIDVLSFFECCLDPEYLFMKKSNISVFGITFLAKLCEHEAYLLGMMAGSPLHKVLTIFVKSLEHMKETIYLTVAAFKLISSLAKHKLGIMWIIEQQLLESFVLPILFSKDECLQKDAVNCISTIWCLKDQCFDASAWIIVRLGVLIEENCVKMGDTPKEGYDVLSIVRVFTLLIDEIYKQGISSEKLLNILQSFKFNPYNHIKSIQSDATVCHKFCFLNNLEKYLQIEKLEKTPSKEQIIAEKDNLLLMTITYAIYRLGVETSLFESSIDMYKYIFLPEGTHERTLCSQSTLTLIYFQSQPLCAVALELMDKLVQDSDICSAIKSDLEEYHSRQVHINRFVRKHFLTGATADSFLLSLSRNISAHVHMRLDTDGFIWTTRILNAITRNIDHIPEIAADFMESLVIQLLHLVNHAWDLVVFPDSFIISILEFLHSISKCFRSEMFLTFCNLNVSCTEAVTGILSKSVHSPKILCAGLGLVESYFESLGSYSIDCDAELNEDLLLNINLFSLLLKSEAVLKDVVPKPGTSRDVPIFYSVSETADDLKLLDHNDPGVRESALILVKSVIESEIVICNMMYWLTDNNILRQVLNCLSDSNGSVVSAAIRVLNILLSYDYVWEIFLTKNVHGFGSVLVAEGRCAEVRIAGVSFISMLFDRHHYGFLDLERFFLPTIQLAVEDEDPIVRRYAAIFMNDHVNSLFIFTKSQSRESQLEMPSPFLTVLIWFSQYGYAKSIMNLYYDTSKNVQAIAKNMSDTIIAGLNKHEMTFLADFNFKMYDLPVEDFVEQFKTHKYCENISKMKQHAISDHFKVPLKPCVTADISEYLEYCSDLTDLLAPEIASMTKYKKKTMETSPQPNKIDNIKPIPVKEFVEFLRHHERARCNDPKNNQKSILANIDTYLTQLQSVPSIHDGDDPCAADCY